PICGYWLLGDGTTFDTLTADDASLLVDGELSIGTLTLNSGKLGGNASITGNLSNVKGVVAPGNSFGVLTIIGDYSQGADGVLELEVRPATNEAKAGVDFDQLSVEGTATFADGATIRILLQPRKYRAVTAYL